MDDAQRREAERLLWRYVVEVVERFDLCPWARRAREKGEICVEVLDDTRVEAVAAAARRVIAQTPMGMVVLARAPLDPRALRRLRDDVLPHVPGGAIADFHPAPPLDLTSAARLVAGLRRTPDPTLQVVRLEVLAAARAAPPPPDRAAQVNMLAGRAAAPAPATADRIAGANLATATAQRAELEAAIAAIHADATASYRRR